jgi:predicted neuraminidase
MSMGAVSERQCLPESSLRRGQAGGEHGIQVDGQQCHASSSLVASQRVLVAWFAGAAEGSPDNQVWFSSAPADDLRDASWSRPVSLLGGYDNVAWWNPVLGIAPDGQLWLFAKRGNQISTWQTWARTSNDNGLTWSDPFELVPGDRGGRGPVKNQPLVLDDGTWLAPGSKESWADEAGGEWDCFVDVSSDSGTTWTEVPVPLDHEPLAGPGIIQPALWAEEDRVYLLARSSEGSAYRSVSTDAGRTWSPAVGSNLPNNNSGLDVSRLPSGNLVCVHNPVALPWGPRCPLVISVSKDNAVTWRTVHILEDCPPEAQGRLVPGEKGVQASGAGEFSYPTVSLAGDHLFVSYTWQRRAIVVVATPLAALEE